MACAISRRTLVAAGAGMGVAAVAAAQLQGVTSAHAAEKAAKPSYKKGSYTGTGTGRGGKVSCRVTFGQDAIESVELLANDETPTMLAQPSRYVPGCIVDGQTLNVEAVSGATLTTNAILDAVADAASQAGADPDALRAADQAPSSSQLKAGTYTATAHGHHSDVTVTVTLGSSSIDALEVDASGETYNISDTAVAVLPGRILDAQSIGVDTVAGATFTSRAIMTATADCLEQAGGVEAVRAFSGRVRSEAADAAPEQVEVDVVVVGSGLAGVSAALAAQDAGASVALVEKLPYTGGTSQTAGGGIVGPNDDSDAEVEAYYEAQMNFECGRMQGQVTDAQYPDPDLVHVLAANIIGDIEWLGTKGMEYTYIPECGEAGSGFTNGCAVLQVGEMGAVNPPNVVGMNIATMLDGFTQRGGQIFTECAATELVADGGRVTGIKASGAKGSYEFACHDVVLAAGGFGNNPAMIEEYAPAYSGEENWTIVGNTGDGIRMGVEAGAATYDDGLFMGNHGHAIMTDADMISPYGDAVTPETALYVNPQGLRMNREHPTSYTGGSTYVNPDVRDYYWAIVNEDVATQTGYLDFVSDGLESGDRHFFKADTLAELAKSIRITPNTLRYTLNRYNGFCETGVDEDFSKTAETLVAMPQESGPWYAVKMEMAYFGTVGGLKINTDCAVLDESGAPIEGLYAAGENANHAFFNLCYMGGRSLAACVTCGRIAGTNAAK